MAQYDEALMVVNGMQDQMSVLARQVAKVFKDSKVSGMEMIFLSAQATAFMGYVISMMQGMSPAMRDDIFYVLEHCDVVLPPVPAVAP